MALCNLQLLVLTYQYVKITAVKMGTFNAKIGAVYNKHVFSSVSAHAPASSSLRAPAAKGRTNVELREQFTLADGVSQSMGTFKSKSPAKSPTSSAASTWSGYSSSSASGPIVKVSSSGSLLLQLQAI